MTDITPDYLVRELKLSRQKLSDLLAAQAENQDWQPETERWSCRYIAAHLATTERECFLERVKQVAAGGQPHFDYYLNSGRNFSRLDLTDSLRDWAASRQALIEQILALPAAAWAVTASHATRGPMTLAGLLQLIIDHDREHLQEVRQLIARQEGHVQS
jgi:hypothetical protein